MDIRKLQRAVVDALEDVKAQDIKVFNTTGQTSLFDRVVIASGTSNRQTRALASSVEDKARDLGIKIIAREGDETGEWMLVDLGDIVVHIMQPAIREYYNLEELWGANPVRVKTGSDVSSSKSRTTTKTVAKKAAGKTVKTAAKKAAKKAAKRAVKKTLASTVKGATASPAAKAAKPVATKVTAAKSASKAAKKVSSSTASKASAKVATKASTNVVAKAVVKKSVAKVATKAATKSAAKKATKSAAKSAAKATDTSPAPAATSKPRARKSPSQAS